MTWQPLLVGTAHDVFSVTMPNRSQEVILPVFQKTQPGCRKNTKEALLGPDRPCIRPEVFALLFWLQIVALFERSCLPFRHGCGERVECLYCRCQMQRGLFHA